MLVNRKIWLGLTLLASGTIATAAIAAAQANEAGEGGEAGAAKQAQGGEAGHGGEAGEGGEGGDFGGQIAKLLAGEGGEGGAGLVKGPGNVSIAALDDAQITQVVSGNTLRTEHHVAYHFNKDGSGEGWEVQWEKVDASKCKAEDLENGECWTSKTIPLPAAKWAVNGGKLCLTPGIPAVVGSGDCAEVYLILSKVGLYGADGKLVGKGSDLHAGKKLDEKVAR